MLTSQNIDDTVAVLKASIPSHMPLLLLTASGVQCAQLYGPTIYGTVFSPLQSQLVKLLPQHTSTSTISSSGSTTTTTNDTNDDDEMNQNNDKERDLDVRNVGYISIPVTDYNRGNERGSEVGGGPVDSGHWSLCLLRLRYATGGALSADAFCFDSLGDRNNEFVKPAIASVLAGLQMYIKSLSSSSSPPQLPSVDTVGITPTPPNFPRQYSPTGCGLYICAVMEVLVGRCATTSGSGCDQTAAINPTLDLSTPVDILALVSKPFEESYRNRLFTQILRK